MNPLTRLVGFLLLLSPSVRAAEHDWPAPARASVTAERVSFSVTSRAGLVTRPFVTTAFPEVSGFASVVTAAAAVQISPVGWFHLKAPVSIVRLDMPAGAQVAKTALGNLELGLEHGVELRASTRFNLTAAWLAPSAEHGPKAALLENRALALASALNGDADSPLLTPGVTGFRIGASIEHSLHPIHLRASLQAPFLLRISDGSLPDDTETHRFGTMPGVDARGAWWVTPGFGVSLGLGMFADLRRVQEPARGHDRRRRLQGLVEPAVHVRLGRHVALGWDASLPIGGSLGGEAWSIGVRCRLGL